MNQILNIFRKDLRRFWREIAVSLAFLAIYAWSEVRIWTGERSWDSVFLHSELPSAMVLISWWFLITRVIQGEPLVGDRQFWVTRPYEWNKLLSAKVLFLLALVNLPLFIADFVMLGKAGVPPAHYIAGLLWMQLLITVFVTLLIAALATVTASVVQMGLSILGILLYAIAVASLTSEISSADFASTRSPWLTAALLIGTALVVVLLQYARRKTLLSRCLIGGFAVAVVVIIVATPYEAAINRDYPPIGAGEPPPVRLALQPVDPVKPGNTFYGGDTVQIQIPISVSGMAEDSIVIVDGFRAAIESTGGVRWNSGWRPASNTIFPEEQRTWFLFTMKKELFDRVKSSATKMHLTVAFTIYRDRSRTEFVIPQGEFSMLDVGLCTTESPLQRGLSCRAPLRGPAFLLVTADAANSTCPPVGGENQNERRGIARAWDVNTSSGPAEFGINPVNSFYLQLRPSQGVDMNWARGAGLCPGTPVVLSGPVRERSNRLELDLGELQLYDYRMGGYDAYGGDGGIMLGTHH